MLILTVINSVVGTFDAERIKQGYGTFVWMKAGEEDESPSEKARYEGNYKDGVRCGVGKMIYPNGDIYEGEWLDNKVYIALLLFFIFARCMVKELICTKNPEIFTVVPGHLILKMAKEDMNLVQIAVFLLVSGKMARLVKAHGNSKVLGTMKVNLNWGGLLVKEDFSL